MADLIDFNKFAQTAISLQNSQEMMRRNDIAEQQFALHEKQQAINQQNANTEYMNSIASFLKDERVKFDPELEGALMNRISQLAGGPKVDFSAIQIGRESKRKFVDGILSQDEGLTREASLELAATVPIDKLDDFVKSYDGLGKIHEDVLKLKQDREMNAAKYETLQDNNAIVSYARPLYTATASAFRDQLRMTETPDYKKLQNLYDLTKKTGGDVATVLSSRPSPGVNKQAVLPLLDGKMSGMAQKADAYANQLFDTVNADQKMLTDADHGIPLPPGLTKAILKAKIETNSVLAGSYRSMQAWYEEPFDKERHTEAKAAAKAIEQRRVDVEALAKSTHADTVKTQQEALAFQQEKEAFKRSQESALAEAQAEYAALPDAQQNSRSAARIARSIKDSTGASVTPEDIAKGAKNPNAPSSVVNVGLAQEKEEAKKVGGGFGEQYIELQKADIASRAKLAKYDRMSQLLTQISTGKLEPTKTSIQAVADSLGIAVDKSLPTKQAFEALSNEIALTLRNPAGGAGMPGALSDKDREFLQGMTPNLAKTPEGNKLIIETAQKLAKRDTEVARMAREYRKKNGQFDEGFFDELDAYSQKHPLFAKPEKAGQPKASSGTLNALPPGSRQIGTSGGKPVYESSDGRRWIGE